MEIRFLNDKSEWESTSKLTYLEVIEEDIFRFVDYFDQDAGETTGLIVELTNGYTVIASLKQIQEALSDYFSFDTAISRRVNEIAKELTEE